MEERMTNLYYDDENKKKQKTKQKKKNKTKQKKGR